MPPPGAPRPVASRWLGGGVAAEPAPHPRWEDRGQVQKGSPSQQAPLPQHGPRPSPVAASERSPGRQRFSPWGAEGAGEQLLSQLPSEPPTQGRREAGSAGRACRAVPASAPGPCSGCGHLGGTPLWLNVVAPNSTPVPEGQYCWSCGAWCWPSEH